MGEPNGNLPGHPKQTMRHPKQPTESSQPAVVARSAASSQADAAAGPPERQHTRRHRKQQQSHRQRLEALVEGQSQVLEMIAQGLPLAQILEGIARWVEAQSQDGVLASLLLLDREGQHLQHGAAPSLPQTYNDAIHGLQVGPAAGSCGTAAFTKHEVIAEDIAVDPLWADFRDLALTHGLRACWSTPLIGRNGHVLGTFALYYRQPRRPTTADRHLIQLVTRTAIFAIERKQAEEAAAHLAAIVTSAEDAIASKTLEGIVTSWNASAERMFGYTAQEMIGQPILLLFPPDRVNEEDMILARIRAGERLEHFETVRVTKDGRHLDVSLTISPMRDRAGTIIGASKIVRDITERKRLERRTREALDALLELAAAMVSEPVASDSAPTPTESTLPHDAPPVGLPAGNSVRAVIGGHADGDHPQDLVGEESNSDFDSAQRAADDVVRRFAALCGRVLACEQIAIIASDPETGLLRTIALTGSAAAQEHQFRGRIAGLRLADRFGPEIAAQLLAGEPMLVDVDRLPKDDPARMLSRHRFFVAPMRAAGLLQGYIGVNFGDEVERYTAENCALALAVAQLVGIVMERARLTSEREEARTREVALAEAKRQMDEFLGMASHELRTPLTTVLANVQLARHTLQTQIREREHERASAGEEAAVQLGGNKRAPHDLHGTYQTYDAGRRSLFTEAMPAPPARRADTDAELKMARIGRFLERSEQQVHRLNRLVGDLLDVSRIQAGKLELRRERCDVLAITRENVEAQRSAWPDRAIALHVDLPARDKALLVDADPDRISQVVTNFLTNALKYSPADQPVTVRVCVVRANNSSEDSQDDTVRLEVRDHGPGLSAEQQAHLFERFYRVPGIEQQSGSGVGLGLGLFICKTIIERHGGAIGVDSVPGDGATFWCTLPVPASKTSSTSHTNP